MSYMTTAGLTASVLQLSSKDQDHLRSKGLELPRNVHALDFVPQQVQLADGAASSLHVLCCSMRYGDALG